MHQVCQGDHSGRSHLQKWSLAQGVFHLHSLSEVIGRTKIYIKGWQTLLCRLFWRIVFQEMHSLQQTYHRNWGHSVHFLRRKTLAQRLLHLQLLQEQHGWKGFHHGRRGYNLSRMRKEEIDGRYGGAVNKSLFVTRHYRTKTKTIVFLISLLHFPQTILINFVFFIK